MAKFDYTRAAWDKAKPKLLPSTGLGKALDAYQAAIVKVHTAKLKDAANDTFRKDVTQLHVLFKKVEETRLAAIKSCGKLFPETKKFLETADPKKQQALLMDSACTPLEPLVTKWTLEMDERIKTMTARLKKAKAELDWIKTPGAASADPKRVATLRKTYMNEGDQKSNSAKDDLGAWGTFIVTNPAFRGYIKPLESRLDHIKKRLALLTDIYNGYRKVTGDLTDAIMDHAAAAKS